MEYRGVYSKTKCKRDSWRGPECNGNAPLAWLKKTGITIASCKNSDGGIVHMSDIKSLQEPGRAQSIILPTCQICQTVARRVK